MKATDAMFASHQEPLCTQVNAKPENVPNELTPLYIHGHQHTSSTITRKRLLFTLNKLLVKWRTFHYALARTIRFFRMLKVRYCFLLEVFGPSGLTNALNRGHRGKLYALPLLSIIAYHILLKYDGLPNHYFYTLRNFSSTLPASVPTLTLLS